jgi:hypothetical protein
MVLTYNALELPYQFQRELNLSVGNLRIRGRDLSCLAGLAAAFDQRTQRIAPERARPGNRG